MEATCFFETSCYCQTTNPYIGLDPSLHKQLHVIHEVSKSKNSIFWILRYCKYALSCLFSQAAGVEPTAVFWDLTQCGSCKNRRFGGTYLHHQGEKNRWAGVTAAVPSSLFLSTVMTEAMCSSESSVITRATRRHVAEGGILHSHRHENSKSYQSTITLALDWRLGPAMDDRWWWIWSIWWN
jgi:hypothetical protein